MLRTARQSHSPTTAYVLQGNTRAKAGYTHTGWTANSGVVIYPVGAEYMVTEAVDFYAQWSELFTVTYNGNSPTTGAVPTHASVSAGTVISVKGNTGSPVLTKTGYYFGGWTALSTNGAATLTGTGAATATLAATNISTTTAGTKYYYVVVTDSATGGSFTMSGGTISSNIGTYGGGVALIGNANGIMYAGTISGNSTSNRGGGFYLHVNSSFRMQGGTISNNTATSAGGGLFVEGNGTMAVGTVTNSNLTLYIAP